MKRSLIILATLFSLNAQAGLDEKKADSKIDKVTVFINGAQIYRSGNFNAGTGTSVILFENVSQFIDPNSLQARGVGEFTILDVKFETHYPQPDQVEQADPNVIPPEIKRKMRLLSDSIQTWNWKLEEIRSSKALLEAEKNMLMNNGMIKGVGKVNDSLELFRNAMTYFHERMLVYNTEMPKLIRREQETNRDLAGMTTRLSELQNWQNQNRLKTDPPKGPIYRLAVTISSDKPVYGKLELNYLVAQAGWTPSYDLRAKELNAPVEISYKGQIRQSTGVDWNNVPITLSTSNPYSRQQKPELSAWYLSYYNPNYYNERAARYKKDMDSYQESAKASVAGAPMSAMQQHLQDDVVANTSVDFAVEAQNMISAEYKIALPYTIKSNGESYMVSVAEKQLKAGYYLALVPKLDNSAFLIANITDWEDLNLIPATARIYYDGTFVGQSFIDPMAMEDTLKLAMGRDNSVTAVRKKLKDKEKDKVINDVREKEAFVEITLRNNHGYAVDLVIEDQVPLSNIQEIKVEDIDLGKAVKNEYTGILTWRTKLKAGGTEKLTFGYRVKFDKNKQLNLASW
jgi:uncharacterized protein (TIGR02231 family)